MTQVALNIIFLRGKGDDGTFGKDKVRKISLFLPCPNTFT